MNYSELLMYILAILEEKKDQELILSFKNFIFDYEEAKKSFAESEQVIDK